MPRNAPVTSASEPDTSSTNSTPNESRAASCTASDAPTTLYSWNPCSAPRSTDRISHRTPVGSVAAAAHGSSCTPITAASCSRARIETTTTPNPAIASRSTQRRTPAPAAGSPAASSALTSRATVVWSACPGTIRMMNAEISAASEP
jgi:hypothetical protein